MNRALKNVQNISISSRVMWVILCISSILCGYLIEPVYTKWRSSPTFTTVASTNYPIWKIDFPAVTVCSNNKVMGKQLTEALKQSP
jgi:hypothetical protein